MFIARPYADASKITAASRCRVLSSEAASALDPVVGTWAVEIDRRVQAELLHALSKRHGSGPIVHSQHEAPQIAIAVHRELALTSQRRAQELMCSTSSRGWRGAGLNVSPV